MILVRTYRTEITAALSLPRRVSRGLRRRAKDFRARAALAQIVRTPGRVAALLNKAKDAVQDTESGWRNPQVTCFLSLASSSPTRVALQADIRSA